MRVEREADELYQELFPHGLVPQILSLVVDTWESFDHPKDTEDEPKITNRFVRALQNEGRRRRARFRPMPHVKDVEEVNLNTGKGFVEIDIYVPHGYDSRCYFAIEAKKLNTAGATRKRKSKAAEYVGTNGMGCFVDGRYSGYQSEGAMVGYVMDGNCTRAKNGITAAIKRRAKILRVPLPFTTMPAKTLPNYPYAFETRHILSRGEFTIHHVFLGA